MISLLYSQPKYTRAQQHFMIADRLVTKPKFGLHAPACALCVIWRSVHTSTPCQVSGGQWPWPVLNRYAHTPAWRHTCGHRATSRAPPPGLLPDRTGHPFTIKYVNKIWGTVYSANGGVHMPKKEEVICQKTTNPMHEWAGREGYRGKGPQICPPQEKSHRVQHTQGTALLLDSRLSFGLRRNSWQKGQWTSHHVWYTNL